MGTIIGSVTTNSNTSLVLRLSHPTFSILREHKSPKINLKYQVLHILSSRGLNVTLKLVLKNKYDFVLSTNNVQSMPVVHLSIIYFLFLLTIVCFRIKSDLVESVCN